MIYGTYNPDNSYYEPGTDPTNPAGGTLPPPPGTTQPPPPPPGTDPNTDPSAQSGVTPGAGGGYGSCPEGQYYEQITGRCLPSPNAGQPPPPVEQPQPSICGEGYFWSQIGNRCMPNNDTNPNPWEGNYCPDGYYYDEEGNYCRPLDPNQAPNPWGLLPPGSNPVAGGTGGTGTTPIPSLGSTGPAFSQPMPEVSPYDVSQSPDPYAAPTDVGGVTAVDPQAQAFDYGGVSDFADAAWQNSMRYIEPQIEQQNERFAQELINRGIDPYSKAGQRAFQQKAMQQSDLMSKSAFDALGFGSGLQQQMFGQDATRAQLANALLQSQMGLDQRGQEFDTTAAMRANQQAFEQTMGLEGLNYRDYLTMIDQQRYQDSLALALAGLTPGPQYTQISTGLPNAPVYQYSQDVAGFNNLFGD